jgi:hypothetical protein
MRSGPGVILATLPVKGRDEDKRVTENGVNDEEEKRKGRERKVRKPRKEFAEVTGSLGRRGS